MAKQAPPAPEELPLLRLIRRSAGAIVEGRRPGITECAFTGVAASPAGRARWLAMVAATVWGLLTRRHTLAEARPAPGPRPELEASSCLLVVVVS